jgi:hypothetical protein
VKRDDHIAKMESQIITPQIKELRIGGSLYYSIQSASWDTIKLKKEIMGEMPSLKERSSKFNYNMIFYRNYEELEKAIRKMKRDKQPLPILIWIIKEKSNFKTTSLFIP